MTAKVMKLQNELTRQMPEQPKKIASTATQMRWLPEDPAYVTA
jgi:hypothetical protein